MDRPISFAAGTALTTITRIGTLALGLGTSVIVARVLGPEGKGVYTMAILLPTLIITFTSLGIAPATTYLTAKEQYPLKIVSGNSMLCAGAISLVSLAIGLVILHIAEEALFTGVAHSYLLLGLATIPGTVFLLYMNSTLLGSHRLKEYNLTHLLHGFMTLAIMSGALLALQAGITGALLAIILSALLAGIILLAWIRRAAGAIAFQPSVRYFKQVAHYGIRVHMGNILAFLNYRVDMFIVNAFLNPTAVGFYSIGVTVGEQLWLVSHSAGTVLFPRVSAESDERRLKSFTPLVSRTVLAITSIGALVVFVISAQLITLLYSTAFLASIGPLQILLPGIIALSVSRVLANDLSGRGRPELNAYIGVATVTSNIALNLLWIPRFGIEGAALASTFSYSLTFIVKLYVYCRISGNRWTSTLLPQRGDWTLYRRSVSAIIRKVRR